MTTEENFNISFDDEQRSIPHLHRSLIPGDKLHRRNPQTVRQEIQSFDDLISEPTLADIHLCEMPGLQNTEQWKRIAARNIQVSPPLARQYYQAANFISQLQDEQKPNGSESNQHRSEQTENTTTIVPTILKKLHHKCIFFVAITTLMIAIIVAVTIGVILVRKPKNITTDYYSGSVLVRAHFDSVLLSPSSTLAKNYEREFCSLVSTTLSDAKTKYAIFYSTCNIYRYRNGSIISDFVLGFTRYQNTTRLGGFLNRMLVSKQLFGGSILSIKFNSTTNNFFNGTDYDTEYG